MSKRNFEEEVVGDSEGEEDELSMFSENLRNGHGPSPGRMSKTAANANYDSTIQTADSTIATVIGISSFTEYPDVTKSTIADASSAPKSAPSHSEAASAGRPRPRPRPAYKGSSASGSGGGMSGSPLEASTSTVRPAAHSPIQTAATPVSDVGSRLDPDTFPQDIAERAKLRTRSTQIKKKPIPNPEDVIDLSSDEDELSILPPKSSSKPKKVRPKKKTKAAHIPADTSISEISLTLPVPTSDIHVITNSPLPPSDPPTSSMSSNQFSTADALLPIESNLSPLSSPIPMPKYKRTRAPPAALYNGALDFEEDVAIGDPSDDHSIPPPAPPTFFAMSSSPPDFAESNVMAKGPPPKDMHDGQTEGKRGASSTAKGDAAVQQPQGPAKKPKARKKVQADSDDEYDGIEEALPKAKAAKSRKRKGGDSDSDEEWGKRSPAKPRRKQAPPKRKSKVVEVLLDPPMCAKPSRAKTRAGQKDKPPKSNEFVVDSDEDSNFSLMPPPPAPGSSSSSPLKTPFSEKDKADDKDVPSPPKKRKISSSGKSVSGASPPTSPSKSILDDPSERPAPSSSKAKGKKRAIVDSDDEDNGAVADTSTATIDPPRAAPSKQGDKENVTPVSRTMTPKFNAFRPPSMASPSVGSSSASKTGVNTHRTNYHAARRSSLPMSELIKKVNSLPGSPFPPTRSNNSPMLKMSRSMISKIAPLHPNRRTPPPPPPRAPPPKKTKKQLELEEKWEMELEDSVDGWYCMTEEERASLRRAKRNMEMGFED